MDKAEQRMDEIMGRLLRTGVILAAVFVLAGGGVYLARHSTPVINYRVFQGEPEELRTVSGIFHEAQFLWLALKHSIIYNRCGVFQGEPEELRTVSGIFHEALALRGRGLIQF